MKSGVSSILTKEPLQLSDKIAEGIKEAHKDLVKRRQAEDGILIKVIDGKITRLRARDIDVSNL